MSGANQQTFANPAIRGGSDLPAAAIAPLSPLHNGRLRPQASVPSHPLALGTGGRWRVAGVATLRPADEAEFGRLVGLPAAGAP
jgi:hypothetical protein